jgi:hypothetical protein
VDQVEPVEITGLQEALEQQELDTIYIWYMQDRAEPPSLEPEGLAERVPHLYQIQA